MISIKIFLADYGGKSLIGVDLIEKGGEIENRKYNDF